MAEVSISEGHSVSTSRRRFIIAIDEVLHADILRFADILKARFAASKIKVAFDFADNFFYPLDLLFC